MLTPSRSQPCGMLLEQIRNTTQSSGKPQETLESHQRDPRLPSREPVLEAIVDHLAPDCLATHVSLVIPHFLKDLPPAVDQLEALGAKREDVYFVPVFYSRQKYVHRTLEREGWQVFTAPAFGSPFYKTVRSTLIRALARAENTQRKVLILEDGGYAVPMLLQEFPDCLNLVAGAVEQTANGCWRDEIAVAKYQAAHNHPVPFPIVTVGECTIKKVVEPPAVADAVLQGIERLLMRDHKGLRGKRVAIMGYGSVGSRVAEGVRSRGARVGVYDKNPEKLVAARNQGFEIPDFSITNETTPDGLDRTSPEVRIHPDLFAFIQRHSIILGTSGHRSITADLISALQDNTYLASCSSKQLEIDIAALEAQAIAVEQAEAIGTRYTLPSPDGQKRIITLLGDGFPINFWGDDAESIPTEHIEFVWALMIYELARIATGDNQQRGLCAPAPWVAEWVAMLYLQHSQR